MKEIILFIHFAINFYYYDHKNTMDGTHRLPNDFELVGLRASKLYSKPRARAGKSKAGLPINQPNDAGKV